jgi:hypothetical protein
MHIIQKTLSSQPDICPASQDVLSCYGTIITVVSAIALCFILTDLSETLTASIIKAVLFIVFFQLNLRNIEFY